MILWAAGGLALFAVIGFLVIPPILKTFLTKTLTERLHRPASIRDISFNPFTWSLQVIGFAIEERDGGTRFISFEELNLNLDAMSLVRMGPVISEVKLRQPFVSIIRNDDFTYNLSDLLEEFGGKSQPQGEPPTQDSKPLRFSINNIQLLDGSIDFSDRPKHAEHTIRELTVVIPFLSNLPRATDIFTEPAFFAVVNGTAVGLQGKTKPFHDSLATEVEFSLRDFEVPKYLEYVPADLNFALPSGLLDCQIILAFTQFTSRNPTLTLTGTIDLKEVVLNAIDDRRILNAPRVAVVLDSIDVFENRARVTSVLVEKPELHVRRDKGGRINLAGLGMKQTSQSPMPAEQSGPPVRQEKRESAPFRLEADEIRIADATLNWNDETTQPPFAAKIQPLTLTVAHFTNEAGKPSGVDLSLVADGGESVTHRGTIVVEPLAAHGSVEVRGVPIKRYAPYYGARLLFGVEKGTVELSARYAYETGPGAPVTTLSDLAVTVESLQLKRHGDREPFATVPELSVADTDVDAEGRTIAVGRINARKGSLIVRRAKDGSISLANLVGAPPPEPPQQAGRGQDHELPYSASVSWTVKIKDLRVDRYALSIEDHVPTDPVKLTVDPLNVTIERFSTAKHSDARVAVEAAIVKAGKLLLAGTAGINPIKASLRVDVPGLDLVPFQSYVTDRFRVTVASGAAATNGVLSVSQTDKQEPSVLYAGAARLDRLAVLDERNAEDLLKFNALALTGLQASTIPFSLHADHVALDDLDVRLVVTEDGTPNVTSLVREQEAGPDHRAQRPSEAKLVSMQPSEEAAGGWPTVTVGTVGLRNGRISFIDRSLKPHYTAALTHIAATVTGLTSEAGKAADLHLQGKLDDTAPLEVRGTVNPLARELFVDLDVDFKGMDLSPLTPYAGKYAGYAIEKGTLSLDLKYVIEGRKLDSSNKALVSQFSFGEPRKSPEATNLPVKLAVSLLKDRHGDIKLNVPVTGSLDDPSFSIFGIVMGVIKNLLMKAATSPFALLSAATGEGEELSHVEFQAGSAEIDAELQRRLKTMASLLADRPEVKVDISGRVDPDKDREALAQLFFQRKLKAQKLADLVKQGHSVSSLDEVTIEPAEYSAYLKKAYKKEDIPGRPTYIFGILKDIPDQEMEQLLNSVISVTEDDLRQLAQRRAQAVKEYLVTAGSVEGERVFLKEPSGPSEQKSPGTSSRVDFAIKQ